MKNCILVAVLLFLASTASGFGGLFAKGKSPSGKSLKTIDEAVGVYLNKYPKKTDRSRSSNADWGMPTQDLDKAKYKVAKDKQMGKVFSDVDESNLKATYQELAKVYGEDVAFQMVKDQPLILAASRANFQPSLEAFIVNFGDEEARAMIARNPGLLFVKPSDAESSEDLTMKMSYIVAATRPFGPVLLYGLLLLVCEPAIEAVSGLPIRQTLFGF
mmetsp:Transcript_7593/g.9931  ORF Transcript_7593/g.9931 Transcript_7593/m.9931 type:complete len:216 (-) Transcript_7593:97-744(-)